jgi:hypothetical protein
MRMEHLPRTGDMLWLNAGLFRVEQVVTTYGQNAQNDEPYSRGVTVFLDEIQDEEIRRKYNTHDPAAYSREDNIRHLCDRKWSR